MLNNIDNLMKEIKCCMKKCEVAENERVLYEHLRAAELCAKKMVTILSEEKRELVSPILTVEEGIKRAKEEVDTWPEWKKSGCKLAFSDER